MSREKRIIRSLGNSTPAEWSPHEGTWLEMVDALHDHENVHLVVADEHQREHVAQQLQYHGIGLHNVDFFIIPTNDVWARDNGPIFVTHPQGEVAITDWTINGWGEGFDYDLDNLVPSRIAEQADLPLFEAPLVLEAGPVGVNSDGTFLATRSSIIDIQHNPGMSQEEIETALRGFAAIAPILSPTGAWAAAVN